MSQNQSYFWQTTSHNVYLKRSAKLQMLLALIAVLTFSVICRAETRPTHNDDNGIEMGVPTVVSADGQQNGKPELYDAMNEQSNSDATKETSKTHNGFLDAFSASISVILFTELGDKTFFIAAIMAMRHPRLIVFAGAISALALMTVLSVVFGMAATIIPKVYTYYISTALFAIFGLKMIYDGYIMKDTDAQEELEEVQSDLRKREDELRAKHGTKYEDSETKRKNSNSDKEDGGVEQHSAGAVTAAQTTLPSSIKNHPEMQQRHRQRKQLNNNNLNTNNSSNKLLNNGCESGNDRTNDYNNDNDDEEACNESDVFLGGGGGVDGDQHLKMSTFHSSPALSSSALSNQTEQTNCDEFMNSPSKHNFKASNDELHTSNNNNYVHNLDHGHGHVNNKQLHAAGAAAMVHSSSASARLASNKATKQGNVVMNGVSGGVGGVGGVAASNNSINSLSSLSLNSATAAAGQSNGELKQLGGSKKRLERDVTATLVQDPESGIVRKNSKKSATYLATRVLMQAFTMTFLAEWGDRSQLTTIILAASKNVYGVIAGGVIGHSICTGLAVIGGRIVAAKISVRTVTILGGIVFLGFALYALIASPDDM